MNISLLNIARTKAWDLRPDTAQYYANAIRNAVELHLDNETEKEEGFFLSKKGCKKDETTIGANFTEKLYVGNIHRIENRLYWDNVELEDDDEIINVVVIDGPITRDGAACSYGSKDHRDQVMYANTIKQVIGHLFIINTPGGEAASRNDYEMALNDCRENNKPTVAFVDGECCSAGMRLSSMCDRTIVMNEKDIVGCIGTMAAFWATAHDTVDRDGSRYVEIVGDKCPEKNAWWRESAAGEYDKLQAEVNKLTDEFHESVRANRPLVTDEQLSGEIFSAKDAIPQLVDEIGNFDRAIECIYELKEGKIKAARFADAGNTEEPKQQDDEPAAEPANDPTEEPTEEPTENPEDDPDNKPVENPDGEQEEKCKEDDDQKEKGKEDDDDGCGDTSTDEKTAVESVTQPNGSDAILTVCPNTVDMVDTYTVGNPGTFYKTSVDLIARSEKDEKISELSNAIAEKDALIDKLKKQVSELNAEVKELAFKPTPMTDANAGVPEGNGMGEAPKQYQKRISRNMSYAEIRKAIKR